MLQLGEWRSGQIEKDVGWNGKQAVFFFLTFDDRSKLAG
jgi:hypothetical protein